jgi:hypothetical protein
MVVIRCGSWPELQDWRKALESEAKTKVKRQHFELVQEKVGDCYTVKPGLQFTLSKFLLITVGILHR